MLDNGTRLTSLRAFVMGQQLEDQSAQAVSHISGQYFTQDLQNTQEDLITHFQGGPLRSGEAIEDRIAYNLAREFKKKWDPQGHTSVISGALAFGSLGVSLGQICAMPSVASLTFCPMKLAKALADTQYFAIQGFHADMVPAEDLRAEHAGGMVPPLPGIFFRPKHTPVPRFVYPQGMVATGRTPFSSEDRPQGFRKPYIVVNGTGWVRDHMLQLYVSVGSKDISQEVVLFYARDGYREAYNEDVWQVVLEKWHNERAPAPTERMNAVELTQDWQWVNSEDSPEDLGLPPAVSEILEDAAELMAFDDLTPHYALAGHTASRDKITAILWAPERSGLRRFTWATQLWLKGFAFARYGEWERARQCVPDANSPEAEDAWACLMEAFPHLDHREDTVDLKSAPASQLDAGQSPFSPSSEAPALGRSGSRGRAPARRSPTPSVYREVHAARGSQEPAPPPDRARRSPYSVQDDTDDDGVPPPPPGGILRENWKGKNYYPHDPLPGEPRFRLVRPLPEDERPEPDPYTTATRGYQKELWVRTKDGGTRHELKYVCGIHECPSAYQFPHSACMAQRSLRGGEILYQDYCRRFQVGVLDHHPDARTSGCKHLHLCCFCSGKHPAWLCGGREHHTEETPGRYEDFAPPRRRWRRREASVTRGAVRGRDRSRPRPSYRSVSEEAEIAN